MAKKLMIKWKVIEVLVSAIKPTPNNFKLHTEEGTARFNTSVGNYGLAGSVILNKDLTLIDGNSRWEKAKELGMKKVFASIPDRQLTPKEFTEFAAIYDLAKRGEVDMKRITDELGTTSSFFKKWGIEMPKVALNKMAEMELQDKVINPTSKRDTGIKVAAMRQLTLIYTNDEAERVLTMAESLYPKFRVDNISDCVMQVLTEVAGVKRFNKKKK